MFWQTHATSAPENTLTLHRQLKQFYSSWAYHFHRQMYNIYIVHYLIIIIFQGGVPFSIKNAKYWPVLAILRTCRHTFYRTKYCGSLPKIRGMGIYSNTHNTIRCTESKSKDRCCCQEDEIAIMFVIQIIMITIKKLVVVKQGGQTYYSLWLTLSFSWCIKFEAKDRWCRQWSSTHW